MAIPVRLMFVVNSLHFLVSHRLGLVREACSRGWVVHVATGPAEHERDAAAAVTLRALGCTLHDLPVSRTGTQARELFYGVFALHKLHRSVRPDIVHHVTPKMVLLGSLAAYLRRDVAVVNAISGLGSVFSGGTNVRRSFGIAVRLLYAVAVRHRRQCIVVQNERDEKFFRGLHLGSTVRFRRFYGSGVDLSEYSPSRAPEGVPLFLLPARMIREKGIEMFARAAIMLRDRGVAARFALCGAVDPLHPRGVSLAELQELHRDTGVEYWGELTEMPAVYASATAVCLPTSYGEGLPRALSEAAACGRAIVTTDIPGCRDTVTDGVSGYLIPPGDVEALSDRLEQLARDRSLSDCMGREGRRLAESRFAVEVVVRGHFDEYEALLRGSI